MTRSYNQDKEGGSQHPRQQGSTPGQVRGQSGHVSHDDRPRMTDVSVQGTPLICFVGWSGSGKTTFVEQVVGMLCDDRIRVGVIKHHGHGDSGLDREGKDTWRYGRAGATPVVASSHTEISIIRKVQRERSLRELAEMIADECDIIIVEGFRHQAPRVIEFMRETYNNDRIFGNEEIEALVTDSPSETGKARDGGLPVFSLEDVEGVAGFIRHYCGAIAETEEETPR